MKIRVLAIFAAVVAMAGRAWGVPVAVRVGAVSAGPVPSFPAEAVTDGQVTAGQGWRIAGDAAGVEQSLIVLPEFPVSAKQLLLQFFFPGPEAESYFGKFGVDVTTDATPSAEGRWMPLILETAGDADPSVPMSATALVVLDARAAPFVLTIRARVPFDGITGFRLRVFPDTWREGKPSLGRAADGSFLLGEFRVETDAPRSSNLALGRQVYCSRQVQAGLPSRNLTDGFHATWSQPERNAQLPDAFFQMDLGQTTALDHLAIRWRQGPERVLPPTGYQLELLTESGGFDGEIVWKADRSRGQMSAGAEVIRAGDGAGEFAGRSLMVLVKGGPGDQPQIAEIEVYPALRPAARQWQADGRELEGEGMVAVPAGTEDLSFTAACAVPAEGIARFRWKLEGWSADWQDTHPGGTVRVRPVPPPGDYQLVMQARHTDGVWDLSGAPLKVRFAPRWWNHAPSAVAALSGLVLAALGAGWWLFARRLRGRLARTEQHLELHRDRLRISRDMHDEIGARLTSIAMLAERTQRQPAGAPQLLDDLARQARTTVEALDTIVWAVNPRHDTAGGLADYLSDYVPSYLEAAGIDCLLDFHISQSGRPLPLSVRHNLLMAAKEALQNMVKHSGARHGIVALTDARDMLELTVTDDGRGFPHERKAGASHTGMESMRQRMAEAGGTCEFLPAADGSGARVRLTVPLAPF